MISYVRSETSYLDVQVLQETLLSQNRPRIPSVERQEDPGNDRGVLHAGVMQVLLVSYLPSVVKTCRGLLEKDMEWNSSWFHVVSVKRPLPTEFFPLHSSWVTCWDGNVPMLLSKLKRIANPRGFLEKQQQFLWALQMNICADSWVNLVSRRVRIAFFTKCGGQ